jgi:hypothetical protein
MDAPDVAEGIEGAHGALMRLTLPVQANSEQQGDVDNDKTVKA